MALWAYALRTVTQVKASPWVTVGAGIDSLIEDFVDSAHAQCDQKRKGADAAPASP